MPNDTTIKNIYKNYDILITSPGIPPKNYIYRLDRFVLREFELGYLNNIIFDILYVDLINVSQATSKHLLTLDNS